MNPTLLLVALTCDPTAASAKVEQAKALSAQSMTLARDIALLTTEIAQLRQYIAEEKANPSGVVDLRRLHELGEDIQIDQGQMAVDKASKARVDAKLAKVLAEGERLIKGCKR